MLTPVGDACALATALEEELKMVDTIVAETPHLEMAGWRCLVVDGKVMVYPFYAGKRPVRYDLPDILALLQQYAVPREPLCVPQLKEIKERLNG